MFTRLFSFARFFYAVYSAVTRGLFTRLVSLLIIVSLLVNTTPAAPNVMLISATEFGQDVRYAFLTSPTLAYLSEIDFWNNPVLAFFFKRKKQQSIAKILILPNGATIRESEEIALTAVALDGNGNPLQGISFTWRAVKQRGQSPALVLPNGIFAPQFPGLFAITAEAAGVQATTTIHVLRDVENTTLKKVHQEKENQAAEASGGKAKKLGVLSRQMEELRGKPMPAPVNNSSRNLEGLPESALGNQNKLPMEKLPKPQGNPVYQEPGPRQYDPNLIRSGQNTVGQNELTENKTEIVVSEENEVVSENEQMSPDGETRSSSSSKKTVQTEKSVETENSAVFGTQPYGYLDGVSGNRIAWGWSYDPDNSSASNVIHFYIDGPAGSGTYVGATTANLPRPDVNQVMGVSGNHGYEFNLPTYYFDNNWHTVYAYGLDLSGDSPKLLTQSPQWFNFPPNNNPNWNNTNSVTADDPGKQPGDPANTGTDGAGSSNFSFSAPVISLGGRGMDVNLSLNYNSLLWHQANSEITYDIDKGFPAPGWTIGFGKMMDMGSTGGAMLEDLDGTRHSYEGTIQPGWTAGYSTYYGRTTDGSFIDYVVGKTPGGISWATARLANGTIISYGAVNNGVAYPNYITDRHGNGIHIAYQNNTGPNIDYVVDNLGRGIYFNYDGSNRLVSVTGPGQNGSTRVYVRIHYKSLGLNYGFSGLNPVVRNTVPQVIDAIYYPDVNTGYWFNDADSYSGYGMIAKVSERRAMSWSGSGNNDQGTITAGNMSREMVYNYPMSPTGLTTAPQYTQMSESWDGMTTSAAVTTYNINNNGSPRTTTITLPNGSKIVQYSFNNPGSWIDGLLNKVESLSPSNQVLSRTVTDWEVGDYNTPRVTQIHNTDEKSQTTRQTFAYDQYYNQVMTVTEYDYTLQNVYRKKVNSYENGNNYRGYYTTINGQNVWSSGRHLFSLVKTEELYDGANVRISRNDYHYDQATLVNTPGVVMYNETYNPHTTQTTQGACNQWEYYEYGYPEYGGYWECVGYEQISVFDSATLARGNLTQSIAYPDALAMTGGIPYDSTYDITGNVRTTTTDCCQQMSFNYTTTTQYSQPESHTKGSASDPNLQMTESATYDFNTGHLNNSTDFNGRTTTYNYDAVGRLTQTTAPTGARTVNGYMDHVLVRTVSIYNSANVRQGFQASWANGRGQVTQTQVVTSDEANHFNPLNWILSNAQYDEMGRKTQETLPYTPGVSGQQWTSYTYDQLSRVTQVTAPDGSTSKTFYNETSRPNSASNNLGQTVRSQDAWGRERWARTDDFGRLVEVVEPDPNGNGSVFSAGNMVTTYTYTAKDELAQVNQGVQLRAFKYDSLGRLTRQKLAEQSGSINDAGQFVGANQGPWSDAFFYDNRSNLIQRVDARGVKTNFGYNFDPLNRLQTVSYDTTGADTNYPIASASPTWLHYMTTGDKTRVRMVQTWGTTEENSYDVESRVSEYKMTLAGRENYPLVTNYLYDSLSRLTEVRYPAAYGMAGNPRKMVTPTYDETSRLKELKVDNQIQMSEIVYNPMSQVTQLKTGAATGNADIEQYSYDAQTGLLTNQKVIKQNTSQTLLDLSYNYNRGLSNGSINGKTGQLTQIIDNLNRNKDRVYEFDTLGRLRTAKGGGATGVGGVTANWTQNYSYDRYGNRTNVSASGITQNSQAVPTDGNPNQTYNNWSNQITTAGYNYDLAGNLVRSQKEDGTWQVLEYDAAGRLTVVKKESDGWIQQVNGYGSSRQRTYSWSYAGALITFYAWGGSSVLAEYTGAGNTNTLDWAKSYIYAGSRLLSTFTKNGASETLEFHHPDRLGTRLVTNNTANTSFEQNTLPFGTALGAETTGTTNQRFTSYDRSDIAKLDYAVNRSYSSGQGRFTSVDPIGIASSEIGNPQSNNLYAYVENNPISFVDPIGLDWVEIQVCEWWSRFYINEDGSKGDEVDPKYRHQRCHTELAWRPDENLGVVTIPLEEEPVSSGGGGLSFLEPTGIVVNVCDMASDIKEFSYRQGDWWKGKNGKWYHGLSGRGPNQFTGSRSIPIAQASKYANIGKFAFGIGSAISVAQAATGEVPPEKAGIDIAFGLLGTIGGPVGAGIAAGGFAIDKTIGYKEFGKGLYETKQNIGAREMLSPKLGPKRCPGVR